MTRGNQRDRDRQKNLDKQAKLKSGNTLSGNAFARKKEDDAAKMREKQAKADAKKAAEGLGGKKK
ncbi:hypothetical protein ASPVEDRAFT_85213 [Aspergillus versicolor CBS 583.65]|uniref:Small EDRK-rich factor-like N-terminal domain-containing protein n=1 Tax=Aspergillus versicolor CBS 583.65 TaxID=1036611 RepID=A0A1L9PQH0_ASPVE|nr:uncharacterized protein ASPVEDRAFT_85213 [Aspergillus versicolor CBS 583.65]OJJ03784.1 hypothetical protein ASPVEDRAFT_85213 [Aspergillus versicolor CBS 583.65]